MNLFGSMYSRFSYCFNCASFSTGSFKTGIAVVDCWVAFSCWLDCCSCSAWLSGISLDGFILFFSLLLASFLYITYCLVLIIFSLGRSSTSNFTSTLTPYYTLSSIDTPSPNIYSLPPTRSPTPLAPYTPTI